MKSHYIDCPELAGKTIQYLRIHQNTGDASFTCSVSCLPNVEATLYKGGTGTPETIHAYEL